MRLVLASALIMSFHLVAEDHHDSFKNIGSQEIVKAYHSRVNDLRNNEFIKSAWNPKKIKIYFTDELTASMIVFISQ